jgi:hypothetical protein
MLSSFIMELSWSNSEYKTLVIFLLLLYINRPFIYTILSVYFALMSTIFHSNYF